MNEQSIWERLQSIDPRYIYVVLLVCVVLPLLVPVSLPNIPSPPAVQAYKEVEHIAAIHPHGFVLIVADWSASTRGESHWQDVAALRQLMRDRLRFAVLSFDPQNPALEGADIDTVNHELAVSTPGYRPYVYGRDYCLWGYRPATAVPQLLKGMVDNVPGTIHADRHDNLLTSLPCMNGIQTLHNIDLIELITPSSLLDTMLQFVVSNGKGTPLVYFPTSVMAPEGYPYLDSGQIAGMVAGIKGAGDYEQLEGVHGSTTRISTALSLVYALILVLIFVGNAAYYIGRGIERRSLGDRRGGGGT